MHAQDIDSILHDAPECDAPTNYHEKLTEIYNKRITQSSTDGTEESSENYDRKVSVERKQKTHITTKGCIEPLHCQKNNLFATDDEENELTETRVSGNVFGKSIVLIHDVIDTGRQLKRAVEVMKSKLYNIRINDGWYYDTLVSNN